MLQLQLLGFVCLYGPAQPACVLAIHVTHMYFSKLAGTRDHQQTYVIVRTKTLMHKGRNVQSPQCTNCDSVRFS